MGINTAFSSLPNPADAANDLSNKLIGYDPKMVLFFASSNYDPNTIAAAMKNAFPKSLTFGCSTSGEIVSGQMLKNSVVAMAFDGPAMLDAKVVVMKNIKTGNPVQQAFGEFEAYFKTPMRDLDFTKYIGIILIDGMSGAEEKIMEKIGDLTDVTFIGASAGDDLKFKETYVYAGGIAYTDAAILALLKPGTPFDLIKTQSFNELPAKLVATKVDAASRTVHEFNNRPALQAYAQALGVQPSEAASRFMHNPIGLMDDGEPYVRSPQQAKGDDIVFYCNVKQGMELSVLESQDIVADTRAVIEAKNAEMNGISGIINFHCILRTLELEKKNQTEAYGKIFSDIPTIGFSTYGEQYIGHINQTSTMLIFK
ncbi:MAG: hypothetical protein A2Y33_02860 [Spirochaetes bacterium GWF1_51_8]|nr:MAG: hypothetical protein A2Y33_02860 [Spirochaetes bacterium GWF1_51_8]